MLVRTDRIGDVILTTPAINFLRLKFPEARIFFLTREYTAPILKHYRFLDEILIYRPEEEHRGIRGHLKLARQLAEKKIDLAFLFYPQATLALSLFMAKIRYRIGTGYRWYSFLLNHKIYEHRKYGRRHELEYNLILLRDFLPEIPKPEEIHFHFVIDQQLQTIKSQALRERGIRSEYLIIHPGSGGSAPTLPPKMYQKILTHVTQKTDLDILLIGDSSEAQLIEEIAGRNGSSKIHTISGAWNLETYMAVISGSRLFISNSTGPLHIARALEIPLIAFYCPATPCSPRRWGPYYRRDSVLLPDIEPCKSCNSEKCPYGNCLELISWERIQALLDQQFDSPGKA